MPSERAMEKAREWLYPGYPKPEDLDDPGDATSLAALLDEFAADEREACAKVCDERETIYRGEAEACESNGEVPDEFDSLADECMGIAVAIRARKGEGK